MRKALPILLVAVCAGCAALDPLLDAPVQVVDPATDEVVSVPLGDAIADNAEPVATTVGGALSAINPVLGLMAAGAVGTLLAGARRKKTPAA